MDKANKKTKTPKIPDALVGHVHGVSRSTVAVSRCRKDKYYPKYQKTQEEIAEAVESLKKEYADG